MSKTGQKANYKKTLVRNTVQKLPKVQNTKKLQYFEVMGEDNQSTAIENYEKLQSPNKNSLLKLSKTIDLVEKAKIKKTPTTTELPLSERMTRLMNFPADRAIYKDLIPLKCTTLVHSSQAPPREPLPLKDREPSLSEFYVPLEANEHYFTSKTKLDIVNKCTNVDNLKLYTLLHANQ